MGRTIAIDEEARLIDGIAPPGGLIANASFPPDCIVLCTERQQVTMRFEGNGSYGSISPYAISIADHDPADFMREHDESVDVDNLQGRTIRGAVRALRTSTTGSSATC